MKGTQSIQNAYPADLEAFNRLVLACQEEAFTVAFSLLGSEGPACDIVQAVFLRVYAGRGEQDLPIPVRILQEVIGMCRRGMPSIASAGVEFIPGWHQLDCIEKEALVLVDVLGKSYPLTALVLDRTEHEVVATVASGRYKLIRLFNSGCHEET